MANTTNTTASSSNQPRRAATALSPARYAQLKADVQSLAQRADKLTNQAKVATHHQLGRRITSERLERKSGYHNAVLRDLSVDTDIALRNLQYAVAFSALYKRLPKLPLSWAHYRLLIDRPDAASRAHYQQRAIAEKLSVHDLARLIAADALPVRDKNAPSIPRPTEVSYLYKVSVNQVIDGDTLDVDIDLGFHTKRRSRFRLAGIDCPELARQGDTRRGDLQSPKHNAGRAARDFVFDRLNNAKTIVVKTERTQRTDLHGRYVAHLFYSPEDLSIDACFTHGTHLNNELIEKNHAKPAV